jgi:hypothetical protein
MTIINNIEIDNKYINKNEINSINTKLNVVVGIIIFMLILHIARTD